MSPVSPTRSVFANNARHHVLIHCVASLQTYISMASAAIKALKDRTGSSSSAIKKYIVANNAGLAFAQHSLRAALKKGVKDGLLSMVKSSFKLTDKVWAHRCFN
jgi:hypothetical protein